MAYSNQTPQEGTFEQYITFYWDDDKESGPQTVTINFQLSDEMLEDFPYDAEEEYGFEEAERLRERWLTDHLYTLLEFGFITDAYGHEEMSTVEDLENELENMDFDALYH